MDQIHDQILQIFNINESLALRVKFAPNFDESIETLLIDSNILFSCGGCEPFKNNSDEEVQENKTDDKEEGDKVEVCSVAATTLYSINLLRIISLILNARECDRGLASRIVHNLDPSFASCNSKQGQQRTAKVLEACVAVHRLLQLDLRE